MNSVGGIFILLIGFTLVKRSNEGFRIIWYIALELFAINFLAVLFFFKLPPQPLELSLATREKLEALDWIRYCLISSQNNPL